MSHRSLFRSFSARAQCLRRFIFPRFTGNSPKRATLRTPGLLFSLVWRRSFRPTIRRDSGNQAANNSRRIRDGLRSTGKNFCFHHVICRRPRPGRPRGSSTLAAGKSMVDVHFSSERMEMSGAGVQDQINPKRSQDVSLRSALERPRR